MDRSEIKAMLDPLKIPVVYGWYEQGQTPKYPYCVINYLNSNDIAADDVNYFSRDRWQVDIVTRRRDEALERKLEKALTDKGLFFYKTQTADSDDAHLIMCYRFTTLGD